MKVYLSEPIAPSAYKKLSSKCEIVDNFDHPEELDGIIVRRAKVSRDVIKKAKNLKLISMHGVGMDTIDLNAAKEYGIKVKNVPAQSTESVAELAVSFILALERKHKAINNGLCHGKYAKFGSDGLMGTEVYGKKIGFIGAGRIAGRTAEIMRTAFHVKCYCFDPNKSIELLDKLGYIKIDTLEELFETMDIVSIHVPLTPNTRNMINAEVLKHANPDLILVNTSRGGIVDEDALYDALTSGKIRAAASDVFTIEPPDKDSSLLKLDNFIATLHVGGSTQEALERVSNEAVDNLLNCLY